MPIAGNGSGKREADEQTRRFIMIIATSIALGAALVLAPATAVHPRNPVYQGSDFATISETHIVGTVCDRERDGNAVYAQYTQSREPNPLTVWDGGDRGCDSINLNTGAFFFRICENDKRGAKQDTCSKWART